MNRKELFSCPEAGPLLRALDRLDRDDLIVYAAGATLMLNALSDMLGISKDCEELDVTIASDSKALLEVADKFSELSVELKKRVDTIRTNMNQRN